MATGNTGYPAALDSDLVRDPESIKNLTLSTAQHATLHTFTNQATLALQTFLGVAGDYTGVASDLTLGSSVLATLKKVSTAFATLRTAVGVVGDSPTANTLNGRVNSLIERVGLKTDAADKDTAFGRIESVKNGVVSVNAAVTTLRTEVFGIIGQPTDASTSSTLYGLLKTKMPIAGGAFTGEITGPPGTSNTSYVTKKQVADTYIPKTGGTFTGQVDVPTGTASTHAVNKAQLEVALDEAKAKRGVLGRLAALSVPPSTWVSLGWDFAVENDPPMWALSPFPERIAPAQAGVYLVTCLIRWEALVSTKSRAVRLQKNGVDLLAQVREPILSGSTQYLSLTQVVRLNGTTDYINLHVWSDAETTQSLASSADRSVSVTRLGA